MLAIQHYSTPQTLPNQKVLSFQFSDPSDGVLVKFHSLQITSRKPTWLKDVEGQQLPVTKCYQTMQTAVRTEPSFVSLFEFERTWRPFCGNGIHWIPTESFVRANRLTCLTPGAVRKCDSDFRSVGLPCRRMPRLQRGLFQTAEMSGAASTPKRTHD
jgi:hypothetical protein